MKKLMITVAALAAGLSLNAASMNWSAPYCFTDSDPDGGSTEYAYKWVLVEAATAAAFDGMSFAGGTLTGADGAKTFTGADITVSDWGQEMKGSTTDATAGKYYALFIYNAEEDAWGKSDPVEGVVNPTDKSGNTLKNIAAINADDDPWGYSSGPCLVASAVPEPTSGLLLLLGVAGLALRRRRA